MHGSLGLRQDEIHVVGRHERRRQLGHEHLTGCLLYTSISSSTVKTHIYRIYRKMGINSQQLLIDTVDDEAIR